MKYRILFILFVLLSFTSINAQNKERIYDNTYNFIDSMLTGSKPVKFQQAVYLTENAYFDNQLDKKAFDDAVRFNTSICRGIIASGNIQNSGALLYDTIDRRIHCETRDGVATFHGTFNNSKITGIIDKPEDAEGWPEYKTYNTVLDKALDISSLSTGIYILSVNTATEKNQYFKVLKK